MLRADVLSSAPAALPGYLVPAFRRGLTLAPGQGSSETVSSEEAMPALSVRISADRLGTGSAEDFILFTLLDVTTEYQAVASATHFALHDPLTGLLNRRGLMPGLDALLQQGAPLPLWSQILTGSRA